MLIIVSPAKTLDYESATLTDERSKPEFVTAANQLVRQLKKLSAGDISQLMSISPKLSALNYERYQNWETTPAAKTTRQAIFAFSGDVYAGLDAASFSKDDLRFAQQCLRVLSGLYGVLRPMDAMQPYRLEMGTKFPVGQAKNLYEFWGDRIAQRLNDDLAKSKQPALINLASKEYFSAVREDRINAPVVTPVFKEKRDGAYKIISFSAKKARGLMSRFVIKNRLRDPEDLKQFNDAGYRHNKKLSRENEWWFTRDGVR